MAAIRISDLLAILNDPQLLPTDELVANRLGNLAVLRDGEYAGYIDLVSSPNDRGLVWLMDDRSARHALLKDYEEREGEITSEELQTFLTEWRQ